MGMTNREYIINRMLDLSDDDLEEIFTSVESMSGGVEGICDYCEKKCGECELAKDGGESCPVTATEWLDAPVVLRRVYGMHESV